MIQGVVWRSCAACSLPWPFPHPGAAPDREWVCQICAAAALAKIQRQIYGLEAAAGGVLRDDGQAFFTDGIGEWRIDSVHWSQVPYQACEVALRAIATMTPGQAEADAVRVAREALEAFQKETDGPS